VNQIFYFLEKNNGNCGDGLFFIFQYFIQKVVKPKS